MKAVIFDMDGVLVDSEHQWKLVEGPLFQKLLPTWKPEDHHQVVGLGVEDLYDFLVEKYALTESKERFLALYDAIAQEVYLKRVTRAEGLPELVADLKKHHIRTAIASSSPKHWIQMVVERFNLHRSFPCIVSVDDLKNRRGKPAPDIYLHTAKCLGIAPKHCIAIEDSAYGIRAAKAAGMYCIGFRNGTNAEQDMTSTDIQIKSLTELNYGRLHRLSPQHG